jgi:hypothetical protein
MRTLFCGFVFTFLACAPSWAQEDLEPRVVGSRGTTTVGLSGFIDKYASSESTFPTHATINTDVTRFITGRIALRGGLIGSTTFGESDEDGASGPGAAALHALGSVLFYFTPQSMVSLYTGGEYRAQLTDRADKDAGTLLGLGGLQAAVSSRASVFVQGGYGGRLTRGDEGEFQSRLVGEIGFRLRF